MPTYFEFEVSLMDIKPRIWRRFLLEAEATFRDLHLAIQDACGWEDCHLHAFRAKERARSAIATNAGADFGPASTTAPLASYFGKPGDRCVYEYDFGDSWMHRVSLKAVRDLPERVHRRLTGGMRAFPLEDSGSIPGYYACAAAAGAVDPDEVGLPEALIEEKRDWMDPDWHPDAFDLDAAREAFDLDQPISLSETDEPFPDDDLFGFSEDEDDDAFGFPEDDEDNVPGAGLLSLLEGAIRVPAGYPIPLPVPPEVRRVLFPVASGNKTLAELLRNASPDTPAVHMTLEQVDDLLNLIGDTMAEADEATRKRLKAAGDHLYAVTLPYVECKDIAAIGTPSEETEGDPFEELILDAENGLLQLGLIDETQLAHRTGRTLADLDEEAGVRLTGPQREAILEHVTLSDEMRRRLTLDTPRIATVRAPLRELAQLHENLEAEVHNTSGNLSNKLWRALRRLRETLDAYVVRRPPGAGGNGDGA